MIKQAEVKPWVIALLGDGSPRRVISRYVNRQDAEDDLRSMRKLIKAANSYVVTLDSSR